MIAGSIIAFFIWGYFTDIRYIAPDLMGGAIIASMATVTVAAAAFSYLWAPEDKHTVSAYAAYLLLIATTGLLVINTGGTASPFIALWMVTAIFAGIFGNPTLVALFIVVNIIY